MRLMVWIPWILAIPLALVWFVVWLMLAVLWLGVFVACFVVVIADHVVRQIRHSPP